MRIFFPALMFLLSVGFSASCQPHKEKIPSNRLQNASSPYLLQHAKNPVNWNPWDEQALSQAKEEQKLMVVSIGYAACHWCHVMEKESFEDTAVARIMNTKFVNIKVDREERPDVDDIYMNACALASKSCGWPLNAITLPDGRPIFIGTYFPKDQWMKILSSITELYEKDPSKAEGYASQLTRAVQQLNGIVKAPGELTFSAEEIKQMASSIIKEMDPKKGGRKGAPKFPMPNIHQFLLYAHIAQQDEASLETVNTILTQMAQGGIYDHLGGGFARYSTDEDWKVPHFEKMLYDNSQLVSLYAKAYQLTSDPLFKEVIEETLSFVKRELTDKEGHFFSSLDADSEGEEGKYYVWEKEKIEEILGGEAEVFSQVYSIRERGNWEEKNILYRKQSLSVHAEELSLSEEVLRERLTKAKKKLLDVREKRIRPGLDDKIITAWNALMIKGYVDAYQALGDETFLQSAVTNGTFLTTKMMTEKGQLYRIYKDQKRSIPAFLDDYARTADACISLYQPTFNVEWLEKAQKLVAFAQEHFYNSRTGMFYYTSDEDPALISRQVEVADNVIPSSNSTMARVLSYLGTLYDQQDYRDMANQMIKNVQEAIQTQPDYYSNWALASVQQTQPLFEIAIVGEKAEAYREELSRSYLGDAILLGNEKEEDLPLLENKYLEGSTMIYICLNKTCRLPVRDVDAAVKLLKEERSRMRDSP
ncbi:MAG: thioredoxin domain-containing protein [Bacteroidota bacterium]